MPRNTRDTYKKPLLVKAGNLYNITFSQPEWRCIPADGLNDTSSDSCSE